MQIYRGWAIALHFVSTVAISGYVFGIGSLWFVIILLVNAGLAAAIALSQGERYRTLKVTLWDEVFGFLIVMLLARFFY